MTAHRVFTLVAIVGWSILASAQAVPRTWDIDGSADATARYERKTVTFTYPFHLRVALQDDGTYRMSTFTVGCTAEPLSDVVGRWRGGLRRMARRLVGDGTRAATRACFGDAIAVHGVRTQISVTGDGTEMAGRFRLRMLLRRRQKDEVEQVHVRVSGHLNGRLLSTEANDPQSALP